MADIREPKSVVVPSEAPPSELGFTRQLLKDGGEEKVVPPPERNDGSEKLRKSEEEGAEGVLLALVNRRPWWKGPVEAEADVEEVAMVTTAEARGFPEEGRDLRPPLCPTVWVAPLFFLFFASDATFPASGAKPSLGPPPERADDTSWKLAVVKRAVPSSSRFCEEAGREAAPPPPPALVLL